MPERLVLASTSPFRRMLLEKAGIAVEVVAPQIDERQAEAPLVESGLGAEDIALVLAEAKAADGAARSAGALTIGADQTLSIGDTRLDKPKDMEEARSHLLRLSGRTHTLNSAVVIARGDEIVWHTVQVASMTMRRLDPGFVGRHLAAVGNPALASVGGYQYEGLGIQLFERVEGDYFTIVGLPMIPLLDQLRRLKAIDG